MVLLGVKGRENQNLVIERAHQEMEMEMKTDNENFGLSRFQQEKEMEKGKENEERRDLEEMEMEVGDSDDWEGGGEEGMDGEVENGIGFVGFQEINEDVGGGGYSKNMPPVDDVCPICFDIFTIPCRSNCGHWFCASCILQLWMFKSSIQPCKCPLCCCQITNLKPEAHLPNQPPDNAFEVLKKVDQYNVLYISGVLGAFNRLLALPLVMRRMFGALIDPNGLRCIYYGVRIIGLLLAFVYEKWEFEFVPTGGLGIQRTFDMGAGVLIVALFLVGLGHRVVLRGRVRRLAAMQARDS